MSVQPSEPAAEDSAGTFEFELPTSYAEERLWFLDQLAPGAGHYNIPIALRVSGPLDAGALERALREIVGRHETLRTRFEAVAGRPRRLVAPDVELRLERVDLSALGSPEDELERRLRTESVRPFDLSRRPLLRATLYRLGEREHVLLVVVHHIVGDAGSTAVFLDELAALYGADGAGERLPDLEAQYPDYAQWERERLEGEWLERELAYWREELKGLGPGLDLPFDRPRPRVQTYRGERPSYPLGPELSRDLLALGRAEGATPFMTLLACFGALLARYSDGGDVAVAIPVSLRSRPELEPLIGLFVNTVLVRVDLSGDPGFAELVRRVRSTTLDALGHAELPFERLVLALRGRRDPSRMPLAQTMFVYEDASPPSIELGAARATAFAVPYDRAKFDLTLAVARRDGSLVCTIEYPTDLFDRASIDRLAAQLRTLAESAVRDPNRPVSQLRLLPDEERDRILRVGGYRGDEPGREEAERDETVVDLFEATARSSPSAPAAADEKGETSYAELSRRSNRLANALAARGVGLETPVGVCLRRGTGLLETVLGVLKAGGAYVPLDPAYPRERLRYMLEQAGARLVVTELAAADALPDLAAEPLLLGELEAAGDEPPPSVAGGARRLAYVVFTSGSSGWPKPVGVEGGSLVAYLRAAAGAYCGGGVLGSVLHSSLGVDLTVTSLLLPLVVGGCVRLLGEGERLEELLGGLVEPCLLKLTPSHLRLLAGLGVRAGVGVRLLVVGGEQLSGADLRAWRLVAPGAALVNEYGPTEATVGCSVYWPRLGEGEPVPIGRPLAGARLAVVDGRLGLMPVGRVGELAIGGPGVARGYLGRPGLTAERFRPDPFTSKPGRLYLSGDRARLRPDGELVFLGRLDAQVKLRGFRVEPGEIEAQLAAHPQLAAAAVRVVEQGEEQRLAAYLVPAPGQAAPEPEQLRAFLADRLPQHMLPDSYTIMERLPLTAGGKLDRAALPEPSTDRAERASRAPTPARTDTERLLVELWRRLLNLDRVGSQDDFFTLGGHSLLATQLTHQIREQLGKQVALAAVFEHPTPARLAAHVDSLDEGRAEPPLRPLGRGSRLTPLPVTFSQERELLLRLRYPDEPQRLVPLAFRLRGPLELDALRAALRDLVARHEALRTVFEGSTQVVRPHESFELGEVDLRRLPDDEREHAASAAAAEAARAFDLAVESLFRAVLVRVAADDALLCLVFEHLVVDGWSQPILLDDLAELYDARLTSRPPALAEVAVQPADYAAWERELLSGERLERLLRYWRGVVDPASVLHELPLGRRAEGAAYRWDSCAEPLDPELTGALASVGRSVGTSEFMLFAASFHLLLHEACAGAETGFLTPVANRRPATERAVGWFSHGVVLPTKVGLDASFRGLVDATRGSVVDAFGHAEIPYARLLRELAPARYLERPESLRFFFTVDRDEPLRLELPAVAAEPVRVPVRLWFDTVGAGVWTGDRPLLSLRFDPDRLPPSDAEALMARWHALLRAAADEPDRPLRALLASA